MTADLRRWLPRLQRLVWVVALGSVGYLAWRYEAVAVPAGVASTFGLVPGDRVILDRRAEALHVGDFVVTVDASGLQGLARLTAELTGPTTSMGPEQSERSGGSGLAAVGGDTAAPWRAVGADGVERVLARRDVVARVILVWPF